MLHSPKIESRLWDDWHVVAELETLRRAGRFATRLLGERVTLQVDPLGGAVSAHCGGREVESVALKYGFVWLCLGRAARDIVEFPECRDEDRLLGTAGSIRVAVSGLRAVENFLDLSHLAFVHAGYLGEEPHTEVKSYAVESSADGGIVATGCRFYQPMASPIAREGFEVSYTYEVLRPYLVVLYKANPVEQQRSDMIALFVQPETEESCVAHILTCYLKHEIDPSAVRRFQQFIFGQDRPILENQLPKRLPLGPRAEFAVRADAASAAYRRWLAEAGIRYGAIPQEASEPSIGIERWFAVARSEEVVRRHVLQAQLFGQELAVWRDDAGSLNAWENRCPHRGVRLSIGCNTGSELRCQYHGWRYASGSGQCTHIPAHPNQKPSSSLRATVYRAAERYGFVWVSLAPQAALPSLPGLEAAPSLSLRSTFVEAPAARVRELLMIGYPFAPDPGAPDAPLIAAAVVAHDEFRLTASGAARGQSATVMFFLSPVSATQTLIHATVQAPGGTSEPLAVLRHHHARLCALRDAAERPVPGSTENDH